MFGKQEKVKWESQAAGHTKVKMGEVIAVVSPGTEINAFLAALGMKPLRKPGKARETISYLVQVGSKIYWPRVSALTSVVPTQQTEPLTND